MKPNIILSENWITQITILLLLIMIRNFKFGRGLGDTLHLTQKDLKRRRAIYPGSYDFNIPTEWMYRASKITYYDGTKTIILKDRRGCIM